MKKRFIASVLAVLMMMSAIVFTPVFADGDAESADKVVITAQTVNVTAGAEEADVIISATIPAAGLASVRFGVQVEGLSITSGTSSIPPERGYAVVGPAPAETVKFMWVDIETPFAENTAPVDLVSFKVALPKDAACGTEYPVKVVISDDPDDFIAADGNATIAVEAVDGAIVIDHALTKVEAKEPTAEQDGNIEYWKCEVCGKFFNEAGEEIDPASVVVPYVNPVTPGDANSDGKVNAKDVTAIMKYIVGTTVKDFNAAAADFDGNGKINAKDVSALMKWIVNNA